MEATQNRFSRWGAVASTCLFLLALTGCVSPYEVFTETPYVYTLPHIDRVAVLDFGNQEFTDRLIESLVYHSKWRIIDRASLNRILQEQNLQHTDRFDREQAALLGRLAAVDLIVHGRYRPGGATIQAIDVKTGTYLAYRTITFDPADPMSFKAQYASTVLLPHTIIAQPDGNWEIYSGDGQDQVFAPLQ